MLTYEIHTYVVFVVIVFVFIVFVVGVQFWLVYMLAKSCNFDLKAECAKAAWPSIGSRKQEMGACLALPYLALPCSALQDDTAAVQRQTCASSLQRHCTGSTEYIALSLSEQRLAVAG